MKQDCKPGSVSDNHLSMPYISIWLKPPARKETGHLFPFLPLPTLLRVGFTRPSDYPEAGELLPRHFALTQGGLSSASGGIFSVALSLKLPSPGVTRHPLPWSPDFPHYRIAPVPRLSVLHLYHYITKKKFCNSQKRGRRKFTSSFFNLCLLQGEPILLLCLR